MSVIPYVASTRAARIIRGLGANGVTQASQLLMRLAEVPILLLLWGASDYGEWLLVAALPTALAFSDGGFTKTARREMAMRAGRGDETGIAAVFQSAWLLLLVLSVAVLLVLSLLLPQMPLVEWLKLKSVTGSGLTLAMLALAAQVFIYFQCGLLHGALTSRGRYGLGELLVALSAGLAFCGMLGGAATGYGMTGAAVGMLIGQSAGYAVMISVYLCQVSSPRYGARQASLAEIKALWFPSLANLAFPLADAMSVQGVRIVVGLSLGPVALAVFSTTRTLCRMALQPVLSIARTVEPELSMAYGTGANLQARRLFLDASRAGFWLSLMLAGLLAIVGPFIYNLWAAGQLDVDVAVMLLLLTASVLNFLWSIALIVPCSTNRHISLSFPFVVTYGVGSVILTGFMSSHGFGLIGVSIGILTAEAFGLALMAHYALPLAGVGKAEWLRAMSRSPRSLVRKIARGTALSSARRHSR